MATAFSPTLCRWLQDLCFFAAAAFDVTVAAFAAGAVTTVTATGARTAPAASIPPARRIRVDEAVEGLRDRVFSFH
jgi:hypothetical protein